MVMRTGDTQNADEDMQTDAAAEARAPSHTCPQYGAPTRVCADA